jgi:outer membrane protein assembly factor BamA
MSSYDRAAAFAGAAREFQIALNQTIGVELIGGVGKTWGGAPDDARFYAGNAERNFLYDGLDSSTSVAFPSGPLMRNLGEAQAGVRSRGGAPRGGTGFWNMSLTVSLPIPKLSRPLIPDVEVAPNLTLKTILKKQVSTSGPSFLASTLQNQGRSEADATAEAASVFSHITPAVEFLADQANLYALKPLIMVDASQVTSASTSGNDVRLGIGGGLQLTVVVARLEVGYVSSVLRERGDDTGNVLFRMTFLNLF